LEWEKNVIFLRYAILGDISNTKREIDHMVC
jgi:hypothetical protein